MAAAGKPHAVSRGDEQTNGDQNAHADAVVGGKAVHGVSIIQRNSHHITLQVALCYAPLFFLFSVAHVTRAVGSPLAGAEPAELVPAVRTSLHKARKYQINAVKDAFNTQ